MKYIIAGTNSGIITYMRFYDCWRSLLYLNINMSASEQLIKLISDVLQPDDANLRKQSEEMLNNIKN